MIKNRLKSKSGQAAIFVLMMFSLIFMFFGMGINIAMLVHHKINLQNAADMAALAGASEQARILNMISWKNYELRKNYKDFVYRYWVQFNDTHRRFPNPYEPDLSANNRNLPSPWFPNASGDGAIAIPSYCLNVLSQKSCEIAPGDEVANQIITPPLGLMLSTIEPVSQMLLQANYNMAKSLTAQLDKHWQDYSYNNGNAALDDGQAYYGRARALYDTYLNPNRADSLPAIMNRAGQYEFPQDIPMAWRNFENERINSTDPTLRMGYYTAPLQEVPIDFDILARKTAYNNLNAKLREQYNQHPDQFFTTLSPENNEYIAVRPGEVDFTIFYTSFPTGIGKIIDPQRMNPIDSGDMVVTLEKLATRLTYYGVMLKSKPDLPFLPGAAPWEMTAVAAAKPFGSRIGPRFSYDDYVIPIPADIQKSSTRALTFPYLPIIRLDENVDINNTQMLFQLKTSLHPFEYRMDNPLPNPLEPFLAPQAWESRRYAFPTPETSRSPIHPTDQPSSLAAGAFPAATSILTSWGPDGQFRAGYSVKLISLQEILPYVDSQFIPTLQDIQH